MSRIKWLVDWKTDWKTEAPPFSRVSYMGDERVVCPQSFDGKRDEPMPKKKTYRYILELKTPWYPRHLADKVLMLPVFAGELLSVTDCQRSDHEAAGYSNGNTYHVSPPDEEKAAIDAIMERLDGLLPQDDVARIRECIQRIVLQGF